MTGRRNALRNGLSGESLGFCAQGVSSPGAVLRLFHVCLSAVAVPCRSDPNSPRLKSTSEACIDSESLGTSNGKDVAATAATASSAGRGFRLMCTNCAPMSAVTLAGPFESNMQQLFLICSGCSDRLLISKFTPEAETSQTGSWRCMEYHGVLKLQLFQLKPFAYGLMEGCLRWNKDSVDFRCRCQNSILLIPPLMHEDTHRHRMTQDDTGTVR